MLGDFKRFHPFEAYMLEIYDFAKADNSWRTQLYTKNKELRSVYIFLLRNREFAGIVALYKKSPDREDILKYLRGSNLSVLVESLTETQDQEKIINDAFKHLDKDGYAEFVQYLEDEGLHKLALDKADDKEFILSWIP